MALLPVVLRSWLFNAQGPEQFKGLCIEEFKLNGGLDPTLESTHGSNCQNALPDGLKYSQKEGRIGNYAIPHCKLVGLDF